MEEVEVIEVNRVRDGGTVIYEDKIGRRYFLWYPTKKVYNSWPIKSAKEIAVKLNIVTSF